jgi:hypothetical protein
MAVTYTPITSQTLSSATSSVTFSSISSTYTDLVLIVSAQSASTNVDLAMRLNSDTGTNYSNTRLYGTGSAAGSERGTNISYIPLDWGIASLGSNSFGTTTINIMNYSNTTTFKTNISRRNLAGTGVDTSVALWRSTAAISTIYLYERNGANFAAGSSFTLYGIKAA